MLTAETAGTICQSALNINYNTSTRIFTTQVACFLMEYLEYSVPNSMLELDFLKLTCYSLTKKLIIPVT